MLLTMWSGPYRRQLGPMGGRCALASRRQISWWPKSGAGRAVVVVRLPIAASDPKGNLAVAKTAHEKLFDHIHDAAAVATKVLKLTNASKSSRTTAPTKSPTDRAHWPAEAQTIDYDLGRDLIASAPPDSNGRCSRGPLSKRDCSAQLFIICSGALNHSSAVL